jgi:TPP-dependent pyruvate/acetoin dehydrogenase alpha subunit
MSLEFDLQSGNITHSKYLDRPLELSMNSTDHLLKQLAIMQSIRAAEIKIAEMRKTGKIGGPVHLGAGQEAIAVGVSKSLRKTDRVFSAHRSHAHLLALGAKPRSLFAELLGRSTGLTKGMGGSMHLWDQPNGFFGSVPIVAGTVPLAVGAGLAAKMQKSGDIGVAYFGDGAAEEGVVHESLNLASQLKIPVLFVCENNLFSSHMHLSQRQPSNLIARFADANKIKNNVVDGNNLIEVESVAKTLIDSIRNGEGPAFIEAITYRHFGHVDWRSDVDVGVNRSEDDLRIWKKRDPINRLCVALIKDFPELEKVISIQLHKITAKINADWEAAEIDPFPNSDSLLNFVYNKVGQ